MAAAIFSSIVNTSLVKFSVWFSIGDANHKSCPLVDVSSKKCNELHLQPLQIVKELFQIVKQQADSHISIEPGLPVLVNILEFY